MDLDAFIDRYDQAWNDHDLDAIMSMHTEDMVFDRERRRGESDRVGRRRPVSLSRRAYCPKGRLLGIARAPGAL